MTEHNDDEALYSDGGYPKDEELKRIETWSGDLNSLLAYVKVLWWNSDWGWSEENGIFVLSTGGWSGNEDLIGALNKNYVFWALCWMSSRRGGHYQFKVPKMDKSPPK